VGGLDHDDEEAAQSGDGCAEAGAMPAGCWATAKTSRDVRRELGVSELDVVPVDATNQ